MNFEQNIEKNRLKIKELPERKIGEKKSKIGSSLDQSFSDVLRWIRLKLAFSLLRAVAVCLRGSHTKWRSLGVEDGAAIRMFD